MFALISLFTLVVLAGTSLVHLSAAAQESSTRVKRIMARQFFKICDPQSKHTIILYQYSFHHRTTCSQLPPFPEVYPLAANTKYTVSFVHCRGYQIHQRMSCHASFSQCGCLQNVPQMLLINKRFNMQKAVVVMLAHQLHNIIQSLIRNGISKWKYRLKIQQFPACWY